MQHFRYIVCDTCSQNVVMGPFDHGNGINLKIGQIVDSAHNGAFTTTEMGLANQTLAIEEQSPGITKGNAV